jgi:hypothetical protein
MEDKKRRLLARQDPASAPPASAADRQKAPTRVKPLSRLSVGWRIGVTAIALVILTCGQLLNTNDFFPLGSLTQYATAKDLNGTVELHVHRRPVPRRGRAAPPRVQHRHRRHRTRRRRVPARPRHRPPRTAAVAGRLLRAPAPGRTDSPRTMILCRTTTQLKNGLSRRRTRTHRRSRPGRCSERSDDARGPQAGRCERPFGCPDPDPRRGGVRESVPPLVHACRALGPGGRVSSVHLRLHHHRCTHDLR